MKRNRYSLCSGIFFNIQNSVYCYVLKRIRINYGKEVSIQWSTPYAVIVGSHENLPADPAIREVVEGNRGDFIKIASLCLE